MTYRNAIDLLTIAARAASARGVSLEEIADVLGCGYRTAQRMIVAVGERFPELDKSHDDESGKARWRLPHTAVARLLVPTAEEMAALASAVDVLAEGSGIDQVQALRSLHAKVLALIPRDRSRAIEADEEELLLAQGDAARPGPTQVADEVVDVAISTALKGASCLRIRYRGWNDTVARERIVAPHGLLLGLRRYLVAVDMGKVHGPVQHFRVDGIEHAVVVDHPFVRRPGFDLAAHADRCFGSYHDDEGVHDVVWRFRPDAERRVSGFLFHPKQTVERDPDGSLIVRFRASGLLEMCWHIYMWGDALEVVSPIELARMVSGHRRADFASLP